MPAAALENLAARFRPGGLFLLHAAARRHGRLPRSAAGLFFHRYVLPLLQYRDAASRALRDSADLLTATPRRRLERSARRHAGRVSVRRETPAARRSGLAGKGSSFRLGEDVVRVCSRLGLDGIWLNQQADELPVYSDEAISARRACCSRMVRDQVRLAGLEPSSIRSPGNWPTPTKN